uniref:MIE2 n=1 Tax=Simian cytomegalovirus TaxID=10364 RepID=Q98683_SCMVC|nr:MIE2 [Simian cytomegalovirus]
MDPRQTKRKADDQPPQHTEGGDPGEGTSAGPEPGPSPPKMSRYDDPGTERAVQFLEKLLEPETKAVLNLGDPLFGYANVPEDEQFKTLEEIMNEDPQDPLRKVQTLGGASDSDILAQAVNQAGIDHSSAGTTITTPSIFTTTTAPSTPQGVVTQPESQPIPPLVCNPETLFIPRKKSRKTDCPTKIIIKPPVPPTSTMIPASQIKKEPEEFFKLQYKDQDIQPTSGCIVISDSEEEEDTQTLIPTASSSSSSENQGVQLTMTTPGSGSVGKMSVESSSSSSSESECCEECGLSSPSTLASPVSPIPPPPPAPVMPSTSGRKPKGPKTKTTKRITTLDCERVRSAMKEKGGVTFTNPKVETKRGRVKQDDVSRMFRMTNRSLEYKNLPFQPTNVHQILSEAVTVCKTMQVSNRGIMLIYTRTHEVKEAVDTARIRLGGICNLAISTPFLMEHTMPHVHNPEITRKTAEACQQGLRAVWDLKTVQPHNLCPRSSDYRTMIINSATPVDFLAAIQVLIPLVQQYPKQVAIRIFSAENTSSFMLPIYDNASRMYAVGQFEEPKDEELENLSMAIEEAIRDMQEDSQ